MNKSLALVSVVCILGLTSATQAGGPGLKKSRASQNKPMGFPGMKKDGIGFNGMKNGMKKDGMGFNGMMNKGNLTKPDQGNRPQDVGQKDFAKNPAGKEEFRKKNLGKASQEQGDKEGKSNGDSPSKEGKSNKAKK